MLWTNSALLSEQPGRGSEDFREVELTRNLRHPNIAALHDANFAEGAFYFTTEYCAGGSLDQLLGRQGGRLEPHRGRAARHPGCGWPGIRAQEGCGAPGPQPAQHPAWYLTRQQVVNFRNVTPAVDVWALAACLHHALTGAYPREFPPDKDPWQNILQADPVPIRRRVPSVPRALASVIDDALREDSNAPFQTGSELRQALLVHSF